MFFGVVFRLVDRCQLFAIPNRNRSPHGKGWTLESLIDSIETLLDPETGPEFDVRKPLLVKTPSSSLVFVL